MTKLIYTAIASLDGYVADADGNWDWSAPDAEVHAFVNELERPVGTHLYGRRLYEVLRAWETMDDPAPEMREYAEIWRAADKVVYSRTLERVSTARTRLEREFDPGAVRELVDGSGSEVSIGGPELAGQALEAGIVDECHLLLSPVVVGGGQSAFPEGAHAALELLAHRTFANGVVHLHYAVERPESSLS